MAILANELRIGNWVFWKGEPLQSTMIGQYGIQSNDGNKVVNAKFHTPDLEPIPLTPEILKQIGFEKQDEWGVINFEPRMGIRFYNFNYAECDITQDGKFIAFKFSHIKYLHQLQNLYYCLCGKEIEIKL